MLKKAHRTLFISSRSRQNKLVVLYPRCTTMPRRIEVSIKDSVKDVTGDRAKERIEKELGIKISFSHFIEVYNIDADLSDEEMQKLGSEVFTDAVIQKYHCDKPAFEHLWKVEIGFLPGVTDNTGKSAREGVKDALGKDVDIYYSRMYAFGGDDIDEDRCIRISQMFYNPLVEHAIIHSPLQPTPPYIPRVELKHGPNVERISLRINEDKLEALAKQRILALNMEELKIIKTHFKDEKFLAERETVGLDEKITDVELELLAQTWSEHCKHKIFNAQITYADKGDSHAIHSLFKTFIQGATEMAKKPYVVSVFKDNGGIIKFNQDWDIAVKVETHNAPSALDPYGGALTGVLGVQRDILGTGMGAKPIANIDVLCFGPLGIKQSELPKGVLHPKRIYDGVTKGVEHGGNKMGIPNVNGSITYEEGYTTRPLVYCGTIGILPSQIDGKRTSEKTIKPGHLAIMVGGRIGKDGIHGATFSSQQIDEHTPQSVVQIGDPITQKKMMDMILEARDLVLYDAITDNGAGGLSSSIGELAQLSGGCEIYLDKCPLKYPGLDPWEILVSESQERMTLAIHPEKLKQLEQLAKKHDTEVSMVGKFTNSGKLHAFYGEQTVAYLDMEFLHEGLPKMKLKAVRKPKEFPQPEIIETDLSDVLKRLLSTPNIATKETVTRQYDHEVKGMSVIKPVMIGPNDAGVIKPLLDSDEGLVIAHGICPKIMQDAYDMASNAFDEAVRNAIAVGAKFGYMACLDNFSWPDPIQSEKTPDGEAKLAELVRACIALHDLAIAYGIPIISGKDSMKNDYYSGERKYSIPPTLLITVVAKMDDVKKAVSAEFKQAGDYIYVLGKTRAEMGGSEYFKLFGNIGNNQPKVRPEETIPTYKAISEAIESGLVSSVHDISDGGLAVALVECAFPTGIGVDVDFSQLQRETDNEDALLFSESPGRFVVSVNEKHCAAFEKLMHGRIFGKIGRVRGDKRFIIRKGHERTIINEDIEDLKIAWNNPRY